MLRTPRRRTNVVLAAAVIAVVAAVVAAAGFLTGGKDSSQSPPPRPPVVAKPAVVPVPDAAVPTTSGLTAALAKVVADPNLGTLTGRISDANTGQQIWEQRAGMPMQPASTTKTLTSAGALLTLDRGAG